MTWRNRFPFILRAPDDPAGGGAPDPAAVADPNAGADPKAGAGDAADWTAGLEPEVREWVTAKAYKGPADVAKAALHAERALSSRIAVPKADAQPADWDAFYAKLGRPETPDAYEFALPEGAEPTDIDKAFHAALRPALHKAGITPPQLGILNEVYNQFTGQAKQQFEAAEAARGDAEAAAAETALRAMPAAELPGGSYETALDLANRFVMASGGEELLTEINRLGMGRSPAVIKALAKAGELISETGDVVQPGAGGEVAGAGPKAEIARIRSDPAHPYNNPKDPGHKAAQDAVAALYAKAYPGSVPG